MKYVITEDDKSIITQHRINYAYRILVLDSDRKVVDTISDFSIDSFSVDASNGVRRTISVTINKKSNIIQYINTYMRFDFQLQVGVYSLRLDDYVWYECGTYSSTAASTNYGASINTVSFNFGDSYVKLDGTRNGQNGGAPTIELPNKDDDGNLIVLKNQLINFVKAEGVKRYIIEDMGEFYGIQANNPDYLEYRKNNPDWDKQPYDLTFSVGSTNASIIEQLVGLYPNQQAYFDVYDNFCANMIPSCNNNPIELDNSFLQKILLASSSESVTYNIQDIKNVTEVWGKDYSIDFYPQTCETQDNVYVLKDLELGKSTAGNKYIAFKPDTTNIDNMMVSLEGIEDFENRPIYSEFTTTPIPAGTMIAGETCVIRFVKNADGDYMAYFLGKYQPHAICVLTDDASDSYYTKEYFSKKYNCTNVTLREESGSPFTIQKIGEVLDVKTGDTFDSIISESVCAQNAIYQNQISSSMNETITLSTIFIPWLDVNIKVEYKKAQDDEVCQYLVKSISHSPSSGTSSITLQKFYPLYYI